MAVFDSGKVTVTSAATKIVTLAAACSVAVSNQSNQQVWVSSSSSVTPATGVLLPDRHTPLNFPVTAGGSLYGCTLFGSADVHYLTGA